MIRGNALAAIIMVMFSVFASAVSNAEDKMHFVASSQFSDVPRQMTSAGFWISRHPSPDQVIMTAQEIASFNARVQNELGLTKDIFRALDSFKTESLVAVFDRTLKDLVEKGFYTQAHVRTDMAFIDASRRNMNLPGVVLGAAPRYGLAVRHTSVRFLPTDDPLYESAGDADFDQLQNSTLDMGSAVAVVHQSLDKGWYYVFTAQSDGWVHSADIALGDLKDVRAYAQNSRVGVVTAARGDVFLDEGMTLFHDDLRMGSRLPLESISDGKAAVLVPSFDKERKLRIVTGYIPQDQVHEGFLPFTARHIFRQAFLMQDRMYGWGGMYGRMDCSAFLNAVFATVGIMLPRDSKDQAMVGGTAFADNVSQESKLAALASAREGVWLLPMKGHIMLYLGTVDNTPYALHALWAYRERKGDKDIPRVVNRVAVSSLFLGEGSQRGSLLRRLSRMVAFVPSQSQGASL